MVFSVLAFVATLAVAFAKNCIPDNTTLIWKSPCDGQTFANRIDASSVTVTQDGQAVDARGGLDLSIPINILSQIVNHYGQTKKPVVDFGIYEYTTLPLGSTCAWRSLPTFGLLNNIDACPMIENCHLEGTPSTLKASVNVKDIAGPLLHLVTTNAYYGLTLTFKDDKTPINCVYIQDKVFKV